MKRKIPPLKGVYVPRIVTPVKTRVNTRRIISQVSADDLPFMVAHRKIQPFRHEYIQRTHNGTLITENPMTVSELMLSVPDTRLN